MQNDFEIRDGVLYRYNPPDIFDDEEIRLLEIPDGVTRIAKRAFADCYLGQVSLTMPDSLTVIEDEAFDSCDGLMQVTLGHNVTHIGNDAFNLASGFTQIEIPDSVTEIGEDAFCGSDLESVSVGKGVRVLKSSPFGLCENLRSIRVSPENPVFHSKDDCLIETASGKLLAGCKCSIIPDDGSVTEIGESAFWGARELNGISVPEPIRKIGHSAFRSCEALAYVRLPETLTDIDDFAFATCRKLTDARLPRNLRYLGESAFGYCDKLAAIELPAALADIGEHAFGHCKKLKAIVPYAADGWKAGNTEIPEKLMAVPKKAAKLFTKKFADFAWKRISRNAATR